MKLVGALGLPLLALAALAGCPRAVEVVGRLPPPDVMGGADAGTGAAGGIGVDAGLPYPAPEWNCGERCWRDLELPSDAPSRFASSPQLASDLRIAYPEAGSLHPINLPDLSVHWTSAIGAMSGEVHRLRVVGSGSQAKTYEFYVRCGQPGLSFGKAPPGDACLAALPTGAWQQVAFDNRDRVVTIHLERADGSGAVSTAERSIQIQFSPDKVEGGLYYLDLGDFGAKWGTIHRLPFGGRKAQKFITGETSDSRFRCVGCHAVSRDGRTIAFAAENESVYGALTVVREDRPTAPVVMPPQNPGPNAHLLSVNHNGTLVLASFGERSGNCDGDGGLLAVYEVATGRELARLDPQRLGLPEGAATKVFFPEWSPEGNEIVAVVATQNYCPWSVVDGAIVRFSYSAGAGFGPATVVVPRDAAMNHFYPTWSPDARWIAFASASRKGNAEEDSYDAANAQLRLVSRNGGTIYELVRATGTPGLASTWPKFAPFEQAGGSLFFLTFNSKRNYGFALLNDLAPEYPQKHPQLWMTAIDLRKLPGDPSYPAVWLPFQDTAQSNHLGYWTTQVVCREGAVQPSAWACGDGQICDKGKCLVGFYE